MSSENNDKKRWFGSKTYGYGWVPNTWQGWASIGVYGIAIFFSTSWFASKEGAEPKVTYTLLYTLMMLLSSTVLVAVSRLKGPKAKWRWGNKDKE